MNVFNVFHRYKPCWHCNGLGEVKVRQRSVGNDVSPSFEMVSCPVCRGTGTLSK
jgi:DnaJ-class molecular chaperone